MSVVTKAAQGRVTNCIFKGVPIRTIWPRPIKPGPGTPISPPLCNRPRVCLTYINPLDPLSCSYQGPPRWVGDWFWNCYGSNCDDFLPDKPLDPCLGNGGGKLLKDLIPFDWNFQRRTIYSNENLKDVFSSKYNKHSAIKLIDNNILRLCGINSFGIQYSVNYHECRYKPYSYTTYNKPIDENTTPKQFENVFYDTRNYSTYLNASIIPYGCGGFDISHSVNTNLQRYGNLPFIYRRLGWDCVYQPLNPIFGEVMNSFLGFRVVKGNRPNNAPPVTFPIEGL